MTMPNFLYVGADKAGSSWLHETLIEHPEVYLTRAKDLYFFDRYFDRGVAWYRDQFAGAGGQPIVGEICQDYLACPEAASRIADTLPGCRLLVTLRDPVDRAFSSYLYMRKHGLGPPTFAEALRTVPPLIEHSRYGAQLRHYRRYIASDQIKLVVFDDLQADPQAFLNQITSWLGISRMALREEQMGARLPASEARLVPLAWAVRTAADAVRAVDGAKVVARFKRSPRMQRLLYRPLGERRPVIDEQDAAEVRRRLAPDLAMLEEDYGIGLAERWAWPA